MAYYFLDSSALGQHYHAEIGTDRVDALLQEPGAQHFISRLTARLEGVSQRLLSHLLQIDWLERCENLLWVHWLLHHLLSYEESLSKHIELSRQSTHMFWMSIQHGFYSTREADFAVEQNGCICR
jgi:hypothetical protein